MRRCLAAIAILFVLGACPGVVNAEEQISFKTPLGLGPVPIPADNAMTEEKIELGRLLYFDKRLSRDGTISCATCHDPQTGWAEPRAAFVHHASDPVGLWHLGLLWSEPDWARPPLGPDMSPEVSWFPYVTWVQVLADLAAGFSTPAGHGHNYGNTHVFAWSALIPPPGWTAADTDRLARHLQS